MREVRLQVQREIARSLSRGPGQLFVFAMISVAEETMERLASRTVGAIPLRVEYDYGGLTLAEDLSGGLYQGGLRQTVYTTARSRMPIGR